MKKTLKKCLVWVVILCMTTGLLPISVIGAGNAGDMNVSGGTANLDYVYDQASKVLTVKTGTVLTISGTSTQDTIVVSNGATANIRIDGLSLTTAESTLGSPLAVSSGSTLNLVLMGTNTLKSNGETYAGLKVPENATLNVSGTGALEVIGGKAGAGIGSDSGSSCGNINISGGTINASCGTASAHGNSGAGIGGGGDGSGGNISIIAAANVTAIGGERASGIGGGFCGNGGSITIGTEGGTVQPVVNAYTFLNSNTNSYPAGAGIGNGSYISTLSDYDDSYEITIYGGTVTATGYNAGIGGDSNDLPQDRSITIYGGTINATAAGSYGYGPGIGGDSNVYDYVTGAQGKLDIEIKGGSITATGGSAGIGGEKQDSGLRDITISGGTVHARAEYIGAGIGGGSSDENSVITITGTARIAEALGGRGGAGIGGTRDGNGGKIVISGNSEIKGEYSDAAMGVEGGAGIGGGASGDGGIIEINTTGEVRASGGYGGAGIGGGSDYSGADGGGNGGNISIYSGTIVANGSEINGACGAGIGGGGSDSSVGGSGGSIKIYGGNVDVIGKLDSTDKTGSSAGIGGGNGGSGGIIEISGGTVNVNYNIDTAFTGPVAAMIGGGSGGSSGDIVISGGNITAYAYNDSTGGNSCYDSNTNGIGHGEGYSGSDGSVVFSGGNIVAGQAGTQDAYCPQVRPLPVNTAGDYLKRVNVYMDKGEFDTYFNDPEIISLTITGANGTYNYGIKDMTDLSLWLPVGNYTANAEIKQGSDFYRLEGTINVPEGLEGRHGTLVAIEKYTATISLSLSPAYSVSYNGLVQAPAAIVTNTSNATLVAGTDYELVYQRKAASSTGAAETITADQIKNAGTYIIKAVGKPDTAYVGMTAEKEYSILPVNISTSYNGPDIMKEYDGTAAVKNGSGSTIDYIDLGITSGVLTGDSLTNVRLISPQYLASEAGSGITISGSGISCDGNDNGNYSLALPYSLKGDIQKRALSLDNVTVADSVYNGESTATVTVEFDEVVTGEFPTASGTVELPNTDVGEYEVEIGNADVTLDEPWDTNYTIADGSVVVTARIVPAAVSGKIKILLLEDSDDDGIADSGDILTAGTSELLPSDAVKCLLFSWSRNGQEIAGADSQDYFISSEDEMKDITVTAAVYGNYTGSITSAAYRVGVKNLSGSLVISGGTSLGDTLVLSGVEPGPILGSDYSLKWYRNGVLVQGANGNEYTITADDLGSKLVAAAEAMGSTYWGSLSSPEFSIPATVPEKPIMSVTPGDRMLTINWQKPHDHGSELTGYLLAINNNNGPVSGSPIALGPEIKGYIKYDLSNDTTYSLQLTAVNSIGSTVSEIYYGKPAGTSNGGGKGSGSSGGGSGKGTTGSTVTPSAATPTVNGNNATVSSTLSTVADSTGLLHARPDSATLSKLIEGAKAAEADNRKAIIELKASAPANANAVEVSIPKTSFSGIAKETNANLSIDAGIGTVTFDAKTLDAIDTSSVNGDISIQIKKLEAQELDESIRALVGDRPVYDFNVMAGNTQVSDFNGGTASISIPYAPKPGEDVNAILVYYISDKGELTSVRGAYDAASKTVRFTTGHFSRYAVGYNKVSYTDVKGTEWYGAAVTFISARGIAKDITGETFKPDKSITRGEFVVMLLRAYNIEPEKAPTENFSDAGNCYYTGYLAAARKLGIVKGVDGNCYKPDSGISRQDMFTILYRALNIMGELPQASAKATLAGYSDGKEVSAYAKEAIEALISRGIVNGSNGKLEPTSGSTRAHIAQLLFNLLTK